MRRLTLQQVFAFTLLGLALLLGALFVLLSRTSRAALIESSGRIREEKTQRIAERVLDNLGGARLSLRHLEGLLHEGAVGSDDPRAIEAGLFAEVAGTPDLAEATFTHAISVGEEEDGGVTLSPHGRWQISVFRTADGAQHLFTDFDHLEGNRFVRDVRARPAGGGFRSAPLVREAGTDIPDPTAHATFYSAAQDRDRVLPSDLHPSQLDDGLPEEQRRVVVTVQKAVEGPDGRFVGVLRVGLLTTMLEQLSKNPTEEDPHRVFFCDSEGRLIARLGAGDHRQWFGEYFRVVPAALPPDVAGALALPLLRTIGSEHPQDTAEVEVAGRRYQATFRYIEDSQEWIVGIVAPESYYLGGLERQRRDLLLASLGLMAVIILLGSLTLRSVRRGLAVVVDSTARLRDFDFRPAPVRLPIRDLQEVGERLELAKTAMRAMGRYVPVDLVRLLYRTGREPVLGGELRDVSLLFTDIEGFTTFSERLDPNELARVLGRYFEVMTAAIHAHQGIIDKYIGDAVMALWNAPAPCPDHARHACEAALACVRASEDLFASAEWKGLPRLITRLGVHRDEVMVGHFGAPDRMSYTALGDGVNLAARLEGLNKLYGTRILVSEAVRREGVEHFAFRRLDRVAVKGKTRAIEVYELLGPAGAPLPTAIPAYERALEAYWARDFAGAARLLAAQSGDPPSRTLIERCQRFRSAPPPDDWDGTWAAMSK